MSAAVEQATQGHRYRVRTGVFDGAEVLCLAGGAMARVARVARIDESKPWPLGSAFLISGGSLMPMSMRYFNGEVPR